MGLIKITTTPIEYDIKIERAKLQVKDVDLTDVNNYRKQIRNNARVSQVNMDASRVKKANEGHKSTNAYQNIAKSRSASTARQTAAADIISNSSAASQAVSSTVSVYTAALAAQNMNGSQDSIDRQVNFTSALSNEKTIDADMFVSSSDLSNLVTQNTQWNISKNEMEFVPGRFHMDIIQLPKVNIEYVGEVNYFPASAEPEYEPAE